MFVCVVFVYVGRIRVNKSTEVIYPGHQNKLMIDSATLLYLLLLLYGIESNGPVLDGDWSVLHECYLDVFQCEMTVFLKMVIGSFALGQVQIQVFDKKPQK